MRLIALMLVRNEDWVIEASLDAALRWCDGVSLVLDRCTDRTKEKAHKILMAAQKPATLNLVEAGRHWDEMALRQGTLHDGRALGGTHFAIVDADEILTHNYLGDVRGWFEKLEPGQALDVPMVPVWDDLDFHRVDDPTWSTAWLTLGFRDRADLTHQPAGDGYQHHNRPPHGIESRVRQGVRGQGGVMHLQFANQRRLLAKHVLYRMVDHLRWPGREDVEKLNWKYDLALDPRGHLELVPGDWWGDYHQDAVSIDPEQVPYQEAEIAKLLGEHGRERFAGLDLKGF